ncbi:hypothetical protein [Deinococcus soli (ex Cha et al. 2016)]|uniref:hypothetical protein n=1 Tax=Deinococcus soli (ex Cha et al. 2016) TaxID=1309411 RepID=UPI001668963C|nr:hypothetical protein [Deinococcus soli (ex Cha et al. 2016)]GGB68773.1 hypothetical protein GCM10008019_26230 [Deinococcus soli (ex Cha et al. 2016)]
MNARRTRAALSGGGLPFQARGARPAPEGRREGRRGPADPDVRTNGGCRSRSGDAVPTWQRPGPLTSADLADVLTRIRQAGPCTPALLAPPDLPDQQRSATREAELLWLQRAFRALRQTGQIRRVNDRYQPVP